MKKKQHIIFGVRPVIEAIQSGKSLDKIWLKSQIAKDLVSEIRSLARKYNIPLQYVPLEKLNRITSNNHQGVIAQLSLIDYYTLEHIIPQLFEEGKIPFILMLDHITDIRNFGAIARNAECAGVQAIVIPDKNTAQLNAEAVKSSAGALMHIPVCRTKDMISTARFLQSSGLKLVAASEKAQQNYTAIDFTTPLALIMGSEEVGISDRLLQISNEKVKIPLFGKIASLNVSAATAILTYECVRQRNAQTEIQIPGIR